MPKKKNPKPLSKQKPEDEVLARVLKRQAA